MLRLCNRAAVKTYQLCSTFSLNHAWLDLQPEAPSPGLLTEKEQRGPHPSWPAHSHPLNRGDIRALQRTRKTQETDEKPPSVFAL